MKNFSIQAIVLFTSLIIGHQLTQAQDFAVTAKGDTIKGTIKLLTYGPDKKIQITDGQQKKTVLSILQVRSFVHKDETYHPVRTEKGYSFMKLIKEGYLSLYAFQIDNLSSYDGIYLYKKDGKGLEMPNLRFKSILSTYLNECPGVADRLESRELRKKNLEQIVDAFNDCIANNTNLSQLRKEGEIAHQKDIESWNALHEKIKSHSDFPEKASALEMVEEIKNKTSHEQKIPIFLIDGLKRALSQTDLKDDLSARKDPEAWNNLEEKIKGHTDFADKNNALEMIAEIQNKIQKNEKIPNFLIEGLKNILNQTDLKADLDSALR